jgi:pimeloyl-ACP methyl ester carboxylesterase
MLEFRADDGALLAYRDRGEGLPLLGLAGLTRDGRDFDYLERRLPQGIRLICLDSRGRGKSQWTGHATYTVAREAQDVVNLLDHLQLDATAMIGSSRGGLVGMLVTLTHKERVLGLCLNDVGPVLERAGLIRIGTYIGIRPAVGTLQEIADRMAATMPGFQHVPEMRWVEETIRHFVQEDNAVGLPYDPDLKIAFETSMAQPPTDAWPLFDACQHVPMALIRGQASDVLSTATCQEMCRRRPDLFFAEVPDRGHIPFLDEPEAIACIKQWLELVRSTSMSRPIQSTRDAVY